MTTEQTSYTYNPMTGSLTQGAGQLATVVWPLGDRIGYSYDQLGRVIGRTINGSSESFQVDNLNRILSHTSPLGTFNIGYLNATYRPLTISFPNGQSTVLSYFNNVGDQRLKEIWNKSSSAATISKFDYGYDVLGRISAWTNGTEAMSFTYDREDQLLDARTFASDGKQTPIPTAFSYGYDSAGNRLTEQVETGPLPNLPQVQLPTYVSQSSYNSVNQLQSRSGAGSALPVRFNGTISEPATATAAGQTATVTPDPTSQTGGQLFTATGTLPTGVNTVQVSATDYGANGGNTTTHNYTVDVEPGVSKSYSYDANGNCMGYTFGPTNVAYAWDAEDRLVQITQTSTGNPTLVSQITYDGFGRRIQIVETSNGTITSTKKFLWCGGQICEEHDANNVVTKRFYPEGQINYQPTTVNLFYTRDHLGSIREMVDSTGAIRARYDYGFFGVRGGNQISSNPIEADFGFTGHYLHGPSGLHLAWFRAYDADAQRWLSRDPLGEGPGSNLYSYVVNNPIGLNDPLGLDHVVVVTDQTSKGDTPLWVLLHPVNSYTHISSNDQLIDVLTAHENNSHEKIDDLDVSGHGHGGGVAYKNGGFDAAELTDEQAAKLRSLLAPNAVVKLWGCNTATGPRKRKELQALADKLHATVVGSTDEVGPGPDASLVNNALADVFEKWVYGLTPEPRWVTFSPNPNGPSASVGGGSIQVPEKDK